MIGNYSEVNVGVKVSGILTLEIYNGTKADLLPFPSGDLALTNDGVNSTGVMQNLLDDGGRSAVDCCKWHELEAVVSSLYTQCRLSSPLAISSRTCISSLTRCLVAPRLEGQTSQRMLVTKVRTRSTSTWPSTRSRLGILSLKLGCRRHHLASQVDAEAVGMSLNNLFVYRCAGPATVVSSQGPQLQAVCIEVRRCLVLFCRRFADGFRATAQRLQARIALSQPMHR